MTTLEYDRETAYVIERTRNRHYRRAAGNRRPNSKRARERASLAERDGNKCFYCALDFTRKIKPTIDHVFPESFCKANGLPKILWDHISNKVLACEPCNQEKASTVPEIEGYYVWLADVIANCTNADIFEQACIYIQKRVFIVPIPQGLTALELSARLAVLKTTQELVSMMMHTRNANRVSGRWAMCSCCKSSFDPSKRTVRTREKRAWKKEIQND